MLSMCKMPNNCQRRETQAIGKWLSLPFGPALTKGGAKPLGWTIASTSNPTDYSIVALQEYTVLIQLGLGGHPQCG